MDEETNRPVGKCPRPTCGKRFEEPVTVTLSGRTGLLWAILMAVFVVVGLQVYDATGRRGVQEFYRVRTLHEPVQEWTARGPVEYAKPGVYRFINHQTGETCGCKGRSCWSRSTQGTLLILLTRRTPDD